jgi:hypothetical protein
MRVCIVHLQHWDHHHQQALCCSPSAAPGLVSTPSSLGLFGRGWDVDCMFNANGISTRVQSLLHGSRFHGRDHPCTVPHARVVTTTATTATATTATATVTTTTHPPPPPTWCTDHYCDHDPLPKRPIVQCTYTRVLHWVCRSYIPWSTQTPKKIQHTGGAISIMTIVLFVNAAVAANDGAAGRAGRHACRPPTLYRNSSLPAHKGLDQWCSLLSATTRPLVCFASFVSSLPLARDWICRALNHGSVLTGNIVSEGLSPLASASAHRTCAPCTRVGGFFAAT